MTELTAEKKFSVLCQITRAQHFAWREAVERLCPEVDATQVVDAMWKVTGEQTAKAYAKHVDASKKPGLAEQVAGCIAWSSQCMGEDALVEPSSDADRDEAFVRHTGCPWYQWHQQRKLLGEDRPGCDRWFQTTLESLNRALGTRVRVETLKSLPDGDDCCLRRFWVED